MTFDYKIKGIETRYNGINFRSRLEAKWARFFDLLNWKWEYEPCDFNGWIPDFVLIGERKNVFVEVKPISNLVQLHNIGITKKIDDCGCPDDCLIAGLSLFDSCNYPDHDFQDLKHQGLVPGYINVGFYLIRGGYNPENDLYKRTDCLLAHATMGKWSDNGLYGFTHQYDETDVITGYRGKKYNCRGNWWSEDSYHHVVNLWKEACNTTQWNPKY